MIHSHIIYANIDSLHTIKTITTEIFYTKKQATHTMHHGDRAPSLKNAKHILWRLNGVHFFNWVYFCRRQKWLMLHGSSKLDYQPWMVHILQDILKTKFSALFSNKSCQICQIYSCPLFVYNNSVIQSLVFYNKAVVLIYKIPIPVLECDTKPRNTKGGWKLILINAIFYWNLVH